MTEMESVDRPVPLEDSGTWRLLLTKLHRDSRGNAESFVLAYSIKRVLRHGGYPDGGRTRHQSRKTEPFLKGWQGAMNHWASYNVDALKNSLSCHRREIDRLTGLRPMSDSVLVTPRPPARPELSSLLLRTLEPSLDPHSPLLSVP